MHTRIKYDYNGPVGFSKQRFRLNGRDLSVIIYIDEFRFEVVDSSDGTVVTKGGNTKNVAVLKKQAKRALNRLGYEFSAETRNRENLSTNEEN